MEDLDPRNSNLLPSGSICQWRSDISKQGPRYHMYLYYLQRLGLATGLMQILGPYDIRRGVSNKVDDMSLCSPLRPNPFLKAGWNE